MIFFKLYITFLKIGALSFGGGYATIPLIRKFVVEENGWMNMSEFLDIVSISQMTPGPIAINCATFVGQKIGGILGSIIATSGVVTVQSILMLSLGYFLFKKHKTFKILNYMLVGIKACIVSLIFITAISLIKSSILTESINIPALATFVIGFVLYLRKVNLYRLLLIGGGIGLIINIVLTSSL
ncbi:chromate transporter [Peptoniphilus asaccharolyticus]